MIQVATGFNLWLWRATGKEGEEGEATILPPLPILPVSPSPRLPSLARDGFFIIYSVLLVYLGHSLTPNPSPRKGEGLLNSPISFEKVL
ncbi:hypothetical protein [[Phormidium] sp. ETS-05]|uniref:hypothetical protein n=1 Tax=[Phormidium] sp. ETS-05 TaxID=222819 RepID=UPI0018EEDF68|nr:hypothetical protein [[Phormidium] sp. ETS-05]